MNSYQQPLGRSVPQSEKDRSSSPLRIKDLASKYGSNVRSTLGNNYKDEEEEYERRRQDEIKKQLNYRDSLGSQKQQQLNRSNFNSIPERDKAPSNVFTLGPQVLQESSNHIPPHIQEQLSNLQSDNSSLMRRLNLVMQELDRVNREKEDVYQKLKMSSNQIADLQRVINDEDNVDKVNKYMSDDLVYERDRNHKLKNQIKELELYRNELVHELRKIQDSQDEIAKDNQQLSYSLQQKLNMIQDIEKEHYFTQEKIKQANNAVEQMKIELMDENTDKSQLQKILNQLISERNDLLNRLDHLTSKYDECVREITHDRTEMENHNKQHVKLITAKIIFQQLEQMQKSRISGAYSEFKQYCSFDQRCHDRLNNFAKVLEKIAHFKMRKGLRHWFSHGIEPLKMKQQSMLLSEQVNDKQLKYKMFIAWKELYDQRIQSYEQKTQAVQKICHLWQQDSSIETKRAFIIWKETLDKFKLKKSRVKKLIYRLYFNKLSQAMNAWINHSSNIDLQVRLNLLSKEFSQKQYLTLLFHNFKYQVTEEKRKRTNILFHCLKVWKDYLAYQKFLMASNVAVMHFKQNCDQTLLKQCFDALRIHKETEKFQRVDVMLNEQEYPFMQQLINETEDIEVHMKFKEKSKACESVKRMMSKQLFSYFMQWKQVNEDYKEKLRTTIKDKIIRVYMAQIRKSFNYWKTLNNENKLRSQQMILNEFQQEQSALTNEVLSITKDIKQREESKDCSQQKTVLKCVTSYQTRLLQIAVGRWRDQVTEMNIKEGGANTIIRRLRLRYLRKAFDLYLAGVKYERKLIIEEQRCALYHKTRNERLKRQVLNAWIIFNENHVKAKKYWYRIYLRLDLGMKQIALKKWKEWNQRCTEKELTKKQNNIVGKIEVLNNHIGKLHEDQTSQQMNIKQMKNQLTTQARRIISNAFARFYYVSETRGFEKWKEYVEFEKRKEMILKRTMNHWRKYQFYFVKSCFQNWILHSNIQQKKDQLKKEEMKLNDNTHNLQHQTKMFTTMKQRLQSEVQEVQQLQQMYNHRLQKSVQLIINKVDNNNYMCQKRYILQQWRDYVQREVGFINCIQKVIQKSLWSKGFQEIKQHSRQVRNQSVKETVLNRFRLKFWKRTCGHAFSKWRQGAFTMVSQFNEELNANTTQLIEEHQKKTAVLKEVNLNRSERIIKKNQLRNLWQSWKNVTQFLKLQHCKDEHYQKQCDIFHKKMALWKWQQRKNATKQARLRYKRLNEKVNRLKLREYFNAFREQFMITKEFCQRLSNLASIHDHQGLKLSFNAIISYAKSKQFVQQTKKANATSDLQQVLSTLLLRKKQQYWAEFRLKSMSQGKEMMVKSFTLLHNLSNQLRHYFNKWKLSANERTLVKELQEEGPIREEVFEIQAQFKNLKRLMEDEGYDEKDLNGALSEEKQRQAMILLKGVRRMQHYNEEKYVIPKAFDRWRQFVHLRKLFKYWLRFASKRGEYIKSDLHYAFDKWKNLHTIEYKALSQMSKQQLEKRMLKNNSVLEEIADDVQDKENVFMHLENQREALLENYVKGQKLALSLMRNYRRRSMHQGFLKWFNTVKTWKNQVSLKQLRHNIELIENLKLRITQLEVDNETLVNENEELKQFSMDGCEIAKNVQVLSAERENLSVDLADKAQMIRKLLDENEKLTTRLRKAQEEATNLINSTMANSQGFKSTKYGDRSPLSKSFY